MFSEKSLHVALKTWYAQPGDRFEVAVEGYVIDLVRDDLLIEVQTRNFSAIKLKLTKLLENYPIRLVHPIPQERWIVKLTDEGELVSRRKSPKKGHITHIFSELVYIYSLMAHPNFTLDVLLIKDEEIQVDDGQGSWRRKGRSIHDRKLLSVAETYLFRQPSDFLAVLPETLPETFTTADLAKHIHPKQRKRLIGKITYCLRHMGMIEQVDKRGQAYVYRISG